MTTGLVTVMGSLLSTLAIGFTLVLIDPLFAVLAIVAGVPVTLTNLRVGRALYSFDVEQTPTDRERAYVQILLTGKDSAKDVRAYNLTDYLRARFDSLYARRIDALRKLIRSRTIQGVAGGLLTAIFSGAVLGLLILFVSDGQHVSRRSRGRRRCPDIARYANSGTGLRCRKPVRKRALHTGFQRVRRSGSEEWPVHGQDRTLHQGWASHRP